VTFMKRNSHLLVHSRFRLSVISGSRPDSSPGDRFQLLSLGIGRMWQMLGSQVATHVQVEKVCFITETMSGRPAINAGSVEPTDWAAARSKRPHGRASWVQRRHPRQRNGWIFIEGRWR